MQKGWTFALTVSVIFLVASTTLYFTLDDVVEAQIRKQVVLKPGAHVTKEWANPTVPVYTKFYFYNLLNKDEVLKGQRPVLKEIGPYVYREHRVKNDLQFEDDGTMVRYRMDHYFTPEPNLTVGLPEVDTVTTLNIPLAVVISKAEQWGHLKVIAFIAKLLNEQSLFITKTVDELLWGYTDPIFAELHKLHSELKVFGIPDVPPEFALQQRNITNDSTKMSRIFTGKGDLTLLTQFQQWQEQEHMSFWGSPFANAINGTEGYFYPPPVKKTDRLYAFVDELFRSGYFEYESSMTVRGINLYRFVIPPVELANSTNNQDNAAFFCFGPPGFLNMSTTNALGPPLFVSKPHFLDTDEDIINSVVGLKPNRAIHDSYLAVEPMTGVLMDAHKRLQINVFLKAEQTLFYDTSKLRTMFYPVMYIDETATVTEDIANKFKNDLLIPLKAGYGTLIGVMALSGLLIVISLTMIIRRRRKLKIQQQQSASGSVNQSDSERAPLLASTT